MKTTLEFTKENPIEVLTLDELKLTYLENNIEGRPMHNDIHHYDLIERIEKLCEKHAMDFAITEIFAAQNKRKGFDGVSIAPHIEAEHGEKSIRAHALRRIFTTIAINNDEDEDTNTGLVIAYHQDGIQLAIGPNVKMCHNQCVMNAQRTVQTYGGNNKVKDVDKLLDIVDDWLHNFNEHRSYDKTVISSMKNINTNYNDVMQLIGRLNAMRVAKDSKHSSLKKNTNLGVMYPLNQAQISEFTEKYLLKCVEIESTEMSLWDVFNIGTEMYKPGDTDFPNIISQNVAWAEFLVENYKLIQ